jgi:hypothetical protein
MMHRRTFLGGLASAVLVGRGGVVTGAGGAAATDLGAVLEGLRKAQGLPGLAAAAVRGDRVVAEGVARAGFGRPRGAGRPDEPARHLKEEAGYVPEPEPEPEREDDAPAALAAAGGVHCAIGDFARFASYVLATIQGKDPLLTPALAGANPAPGCRRRQRRASAPVLRRLTGHLGRLRALARRERGRGRRRQRRRGQCPGRHSGGEGALPGHRR